MLNELSVRFRVIITTFISLRLFLICLGSRSGCLLLALVPCSPSEEGLRSFCPAPASVLVHFSFPLQGSSASRFLREAPDGPDQRTPWRPCPRRPASSPHPPTSSSVQTCVTCVSRGAARFMTPGPQVCALARCVPSAQTVLGTWSCSVNTDGLIHERSALVFAPSRPLLESCVLRAIE